MLTKEHAKLATEPGATSNIRADWVTTTSLTMKGASGFYRCLRPLIYQVVENSIHEAITQHNRAI